MSLFRKWVDVADVSEFAESDRKQLFTPDGEEIGLYCVDGEYFAISNTCTHAMASMIGGVVAGHEIECPLHGARFDLRDGKNLTPPAVRPLKTFAVKREGDRLWIKI